MRTRRNQAWPAGRCGSCRKISFIVLQPPNHDARVYPDINGRTASIRPPGKALHRRNERLPRLGERNQDVARRSGRRRCSTSSSRGDHDRQALNAARPCDVICEHVRRLVEEREPERYRPQIRNRLSWISGRPSSSHRVTPFALQTLRTCGTKLKVDARRRLQSDRIVRPERSASLVKPLILSDICSENDGRDRSVSASSLSPVKRAVSMACHSPCCNQAASAHASNRCLLGDPKRRGVLTCSRCHSRASTS